MGFFGRDYYLILALILCGVNFTLSQIVCVHVKDCPAAYELLKRKNGQELFEKLICENDARYPKIWCKIPCLTNSNAKGFCTLNANCATATIDVNSTEPDTCNTQISSPNEYICCPSDVGTTNTPQPTPTETTQTANIITTTETTIDSRYNQPDSEICGIQSDVYRIAYGKITSMSDHPWSALLQYSDKGKLSYRCGGALISNKFVITAAHCVHRTREKLVKVVLGEYNVSSKVDCFRGYCMPHPLTVDIRNIIVHPGWLNAERLFYNDIALIELQSEVKYNEFVRPICLSSIHTKPKGEVTVVGWGKTEFGKLSEVKRMANLQIQAKSSCLNTVRIPLKESQLCVGGDQADSCDGDSGGPLMEVDYSGVQPIWRLVGLVSLGSWKCGSIGKPAIYTSVPYYYEWILENIV